MGKWKTWEAELADIVKRVGFGPTPITTPPTFDVAPVVSGTSKWKLAVGGKSIALPGGKGDTAEQCAVFVAANHALVASPEDLVWRIELASGKATKHAAGHVGAYAVSTVDAKHYLLVVNSGGARFPNGALQLRRFDNKPALVTLYSPSFSAVRQIGALPLAWTLSTLSGERHHIATTKAVTRLIVVQTKRGLATFRDFSLAGTDYRIATADGRNYLVSGKRVWDLGDPAAIAKAHAAYLE